MFVADYRDRNHGLPPGVTFVEYQDKMVKGLKNISRNSQDMVNTFLRVGRVLYSSIITYVRTYICVTALLFCFSSL